MLGWIRSGIVGAIVCLSFAACGGDDFSSEAPGSGDASVGGSGATGGSAAGGAAGVVGTGGTAGNPVVDAAPEAAGNCATPMAGTTCNDLTTGVQVCDECGQTNCCTQVETCLADATCSRAMRCYLDHCFDQPAVECMVENCTCVTGAIGTFTGMSNCLLNACGNTGICPQFQG